MRLMVWLLKASWRIALLAALVGGLCGAASVGLVALMLRTLRAPDAAPGWLVGLYAGLCAVILLTRIGSQLLISRLTQDSMSQLRLRLCRRVLETPLAQLEEIGEHRLVAALTGDVTTVTRALNGVPGLGINLTILGCGLVYLGILSPSLMLAAVFFCALGMTSYWYSARAARKYVRRARDEHDVLHKHLQEVMAGVKELKIHRERRQAFLQQLERVDATVRESQFLGDGLQNAATSWGRLTFFFAIGLLLFLWPRIQSVDVVTLTGYALTILYLMGPLEQIMGWLPVMGWASASAAKIESLGLLLDKADEECTEFRPRTAWEQIEFRGVTHAYRRDGQAHGFTLGPLDLEFRTGEIVFLIGGNGSGKTTLGKLLTGLYLPADGVLCVDGQPITATQREGYRQLFSVVFDDVVLFDSLWGLEAAALDERAQRYLQELELDHLVTVTDGAFSTIRLSRGQRKRLALLTAYLENRPIYVFDEWAADQDPVFRRVFYERLLPELKSRGKTVVAITHDDRYFAAADRVIKLEEGHVVESFRHERSPHAEG